MTRIALLLLVCAFQAHAFNADESDFLTFQCTDTGEVSPIVELKVEDQRVDYKPRNRSLYLEEGESVVGRLLIDVSQTDEVISNAFKYPLHTLKYKKFLANKSILMVGDGKSYLEQESVASWLTEHLNVNVKIYLGGKPQWLVANGLATDEPLSMSSGEFVAESKLGSWYFVESQEELNLAISQHQLDSLDRRYLVVKEGLLNGLSVPDALKFSFYELQGGKEALDRYAKNQGLMLSALAARELKARCEN